MQGDQFQMQKMKQLIKANKNLQVQYEKEKNARIKLEKQIQEISKETDRELVVNKERQSQLQPPKTSGRSVNMNETMVSQMTNVTGITTGTQMSQQTAIKKIGDQRYKLQQQKNEINKCLRVIRNEVGD